MKAPQETSHAWNQIETHLNFALQHLKDGTEAGNLRLGHQAAEFLVEVPVDVLPRNRHYQVTLAGASSEPTVDSALADMVVGAACVTVAGAVGPGADSVGVEADSESRPEAPS